MSNEINTGAKWIYSRLSESLLIADFVGIHPITKVSQIYEKIAPFNATFPYCVFSHSSSRVVSYVDGTKSLVFSYWHIHFYAETDSYFIFEAVTDELSEVLCFNSGDFPVTNVIAGCREVRPLQTIEIFEGIPRRGMGAVYELGVYPR